MTSNSDQQPVRLEPPELSYRDRSIWTDTGASVCPECSQRNPISQLWCPHCKAALPANASCEMEDEQEPLIERSELYQHVLADLPHLLTHAKMDPSLYRSIYDFYKSQLQKVQQRIRSHEVHNSRCKLLAEVKSLAHHGRIQDALGRIVREQTLDPDDPILQDIRKELAARWEWIQQEQRQSAQVQKLRQEAKACIEAKQYQGAVEKLQAALDLQPENRDLQALLKQTESQRIQQVTEVKEEAPGVETDGTQAQRVGEGITTSATTQSLELDSNGDRGVRRREEPAQLAPALQATSSRPAHSFAEEEEIPSPVQRQINAFSEWAELVKPFLLDNVGWFVGTFLVIAGFVVLIVTFWNTIEQNQILMHSLVFATMFLATGMFFAVAYFMRVRYPQLESSSDVLLVIVALLIPLVFAAAALTSLIPAAEIVDATANLGWWRAQ